MISEGPESATMTIYSLMWCARVLDDTMTAEFHVTSTTKSQLEAFGPASSNRRTSL